MYDTPSRPLISLSQSLYETGFFSYVGFDQIMDPLPRRGCSIINYNRCHLHELTLHSTSSKKEKDSVYLNHIEKALLLKCDQILRLCKRTFHTSALNESVFQSCLQSTPCKNTLTPFILHREKEGFKQKSNTLIWALMIYAC